MQYCNMVIAKPIPVHEVPGLETGSVAFVNQHMNILMWIGVLLSYLVYIFAKSTSLLEFARLSHAYITNSHMHSCRTIKECTKSAQFKICKQEWDTQVGLSHICAGLYSLCAAGGNPGFGSRAVNRAHSINISAAFENGDRMTDSFSIRFFEVKPSTSGMDVLWLSLVKYKLHGTECWLALVQSDLDPTFRHCLKII